MTDYAHPDRLISTEVSRGSTTDHWRSSRSMRTPPRTRRATSPARSAQLAAGAARLAPPRLRHRRAPRRSARRARYHRRPERRALRREQQLVRGLRVLALRLRGVENVVLLNGGRKKWELESRPMDSERPRPGHVLRIGQRGPGCASSATR